MQTRREVAGVPSRTEPDWASDAEVSPIRFTEGAPPSKATVDALAEALRLDEGERRHLRSLARGVEREPFVRETVPEGLRRVVERLPGLA